MYPKEIVFYENLRFCKRPDRNSCIATKEIGIKKGTKIIVLDNGDSIILKPMNEQYLERLRGSLKGKGALETLIEERHKDKEKE